jgi:hypothetical protein
LTVASLSTTEDPFNLLFLTLFFLTSLFLNLTYQTSASDWVAGTMRPLYLYKGTYPATITSVRGTTWHPDNLEGTQEQLEAWGLESPITGHIPQVSEELFCTATTTNF